MTGFYAAYGILGALYERDASDTAAAAARVEVSMLEAMAHFNLDAFTHSVQRRRGDGAVQPAERVAVVRAALRRRQVDRAAHVVAAEVLAGPGQGDRAARPVRRPALRDARGAHRSTRKTLIDVLGDRSSARAAARRVVPRGSRRSTCRTRRCTTPTRCPTIRRPSTCSCSSMRRTRRCGKRFRTVRSPV